MKNIILATFFLILGLSSREQITIMPELPPIGLTVKTQLWNLTLMNPSSTGVNVQISLTVTDVSTNQVVFTAQTRNLYLPPSAKQITNREVMPVVYTGNNPSYPVDANPNGFLPIGVFNFCYVVTAAGGHEATSDEACDQAPVEPLSPPMLVSPADSERVDNSRPMFIWIPPVPSTLFNNLSYDYHLVEVQPTQSSADAVQQNIPVLFQPNVKGTNLQYPLSAPVLDSNKLYAWQIVAKNNSTPVGTSEAWAFRLRKDTPVIKKPLPPSFYTKLSRENGNGITVCNGILHFAYLQETNAKTVHIEMTDITSNKQNKVTLDSTEYAVRYGDNLMNIDLTDVGGMKQKHFYLMDLTNGVGEHWYLKFEYVKQD
jgi:hypothetical protein